MGRWNRKKKSRKPAAVRASSNDVWLYQPAQRDLLKYLDRYRKAARAFANEDSLDDDDAMHKPATIGDVEFPTPATIYNKPFFSISTELTTKQRKVLHQCCQELDLFHITSEGTFYISFFADGFDHIKGWKPTPLAAYRHMYVYKPWYCRRANNGSAPSIAGNGHVLKAESSNTIESSSKKRTLLKSDADEAILELIDHSETCLRDERDALVYKKLNGADLNTLGGDPNGSDIVWELVDTETKLRAAVEEIRHSKELAFDLESYGTGKFEQITCLLQLATDSGKEYIVDVLAPGVWDAVRDCLAPLFADPQILKVGHSISGLDVRSLHRDFGCFVINAFDTHEAARVLELPSHGLASVCGHYGLQTEEFSQLKEEHQRGDWRRRPLSSSQLEYARSDVRYLLRLRWLMMRDMVYNDFWGRTESNLVRERIAAEWRASLMRFELAEDGMLDEAEDKKMDALEVWKPDTQDDAATFKTSNDGQNTVGDDDLLFLTPTNSQANLLGSFDDDDEEEECDDDLTSDITVAQLRLQPLVMRCLWLSQEACRDFWTTPTEPHLKHETFVNLQKRFRKNEITWLPSNTRLYEELVRWRDQVACEMECLPSFLIPLDFLVLVAWKRPTTETRLRRIRCDLPGILETEEKYRKELLDVVLRNAIETGCPIVNDIYFFSDTGSDDNQKARNWGDYEKLAFRLAVAGILCGALLGVVIEGSRMRARQSR